MGHRDLIGLLVVASAWGGCVLAWDDLDPKLGASTTTSSSSGGSAPSGGTGGVAGAGGSGGVMSVGGGGGMPNGGELVWVKAFGSSDDDIALAVATDVAGTIWVGGTVGSAADFGSGPLPHAGGNDMALLHLDADGNHLGSAAFGSSGEDNIVAIAAHPQDGIVVAGDYQGAFDLGAACPLTASSAEDTFVARFSAEGDCQCALTLGGAGSQRSKSLTFGPGGDLYWLGSFDQELTVASSVIATSAGGADTFVVTMDDNCTMVDSKTIGGSGKDEAGQVFTLADGSYLLSFVTSGDADVGGLTHVNSGLDDALLTKIGPDGVADWLVAFTGPTDQSAAKIARAGADTYWATQSFTDAVDYPGGQLTGGDSDFATFLVDGQGAVSLPQAFGGPGSQVVNSIGAATDGSLRLTGFHQTSFSLEDRAVVHIDDIDTFVTRLEPTGEVAWVQAMVGPAVDRPKDTTVDVAGNTLVVGQFDESLTVAGEVLASVGPRSWFVLKLAP